MLSRLCRLRTLSELLSWHPVLFGFFSRRWSLSRPLPLPLPLPWPAVVLRALSESPEGCVCEDRAKVRPASLRLMRHTLAISMHLLLIRERERASGRGHQGHFRWPRKPVCTLRDGQCPGPIAHLCSRHPAPLCGCLQFSQKSPFLTPDLPPGSVSSLT